MIREKIQNEPVTTRLQYCSGFSSAVLESIADAIVIMDAAGRIQYANEAAQQLTGYRPEQPQKQCLADLFELVDEVSGDLHPDPLFACFRDKRSIQLNNHYLLRRADGTEVAVDGSISPLQRNKNLCDGVVLLLIDATESRRKTREITYQATHDALTNLVNRREFERRLDHVLHRDDKTPGHALLYMDLDHFKIINDSCGHPAGDEALRQAANVFRSVIRERDTLGRLGGDEFALLMEYCPKDRAVHAAHQLCRALLDYRFCWKGQSFRIGVSNCCTWISITSRSSMTVAGILPEMKPYGRPPMCFVRLSANVIRWAAWVAMSLRC